VREWGEGHKVLDIEVYICICMYVCVCVRACGECAMENHLDL
jgi:hypothetical protein